MRSAGRVNNILFLCLLLLLPSCEGTSFKSSVPTYPVRVVIDTRVGEFVHFQPTQLNAYTVVNKDGYFLNDKYVLPVSAMDAWGYGGVVVYVSTNGYDAYDLACPYCAARGQCRPCQMDAIYARCPECGEEYDMSAGVAMPQHGLSHEALRRLNIIHSDGKLTVTQK